ncbi:hypothetical protein MANES_07G130502v8 [Manihot esculenta]|uniref:Uncharacterized protein n=1 Tax=Manihot esculenta TaxID=3983 RepID=A0ACB7HHK8_MANES|nr:hypothetical protein MANES_07G130502v8 [Manihot esculenta]
MENEWYQMPFAVKDGCWRCSSSSKSSSSSSSSIFIHLDAKYFVLPLKFLSLFLS